MKWAPTTVHWPLWFPLKTLASGAHFQSLNMFGESKGHFLSFFFFLEKKFQKFREGISVREECLPSWPLHDEIAATYFWWGVREGHYKTLDLVLKRSENCKCKSNFNGKERLISVSFEIAVRERAWIFNLDRKTKKKFTSEALKTHSI